MSKKESTAEELIKEIATIIRESSEELEEEEVARRIINHIIATRRGVIT